MYCAPHPHPPIFSPAPPPQYQSCSAIPGPAEKQVSRKVKLFLNTGLQFRRRRPTSGSAGKDFYKLTTSSCTGNESSWWSLWLSSWWKSASTRNIFLKIQKLLLKVWTKSFLVRPPCWNPSSRVRTRKLVHSFKVQSQFPDWSKRSCTVFMVISFISVPVGSLSCEGVGNVDCKTQFTSGF